MNVGSWLIGGTLGQALCKLHDFLADCSLLVSIQSLVLIAVDRFGALVVPLRSSVVTRRVLRTLSCRNVVKKRALSEVYVCFLVFTISNAKPAKKSRT